VGRVETAGYQSALGRALRQNSEHTIDDKKLDALSKTCIAATAGVVPFGSIKKRFTIAAVSTAVVVGAVVTGVVLYQSGTQQTNIPVSSSTSVSVTPQYAAGEISFDGDNQYGYIDPKTAVLADNAAPDDLVRFEILSPDGKTVAQGEGKDASSALNSISAGAGAYTLRFEIREPNGAVSNFSRVFVRTE